MKAVEAVVKELKGNRFVEKLETFLTKNSIDYVCMQGVIGETAYCLHWESTHQDGANGWTPFRLVLVQFYWSYAFVFVGVWWIASAQVASAQVDFVAIFLLVGENLGEIDYLGCHHGGHHHLGGGTHLGGQNKSTMLLRSQNQSTILLGGHHKSNTLLEGQNMSNTLLGGQNQPNIIQKSPTICYN